ncbi:MAG: 30S ribosomal protein S1 [Candidatus Oxydemutatoraceae bacterium WSBS_2016_MAG_OTU14]
MLESFAEIFEQEQRSLEKADSLLQGTVVQIKNGVVVVNVNLKSEGFIPINQFYNEQGELEVAEGDTVEVVLDSIENGLGETRLSRDKAKRLKVWEGLERAYEDSSIITGRIINRVKGGFIVDLGGATAFLPGSLVDIRPVAQDSTYLENKDLEFKVIKLDKPRNNIVLSRRSVMEMEFTSERQELIKRLKSETVVKGVVKNLTDYGAFIDLGGIDGLLHITDMSWKRVQHPSEIVSIGDEIEVKVLDYDEEKVRVSLGLKQLGNDPWLDIAQKYPVGSRVFGKITNIADYGCFVEVESGIEGLVHVSEMDWCNKNIHPSKLVSIGQEVEVMLLDLNKERRRMSLGFKQCKDNPWEEFSKSYTRGDIVKGQIKSITDFGIFIGLASHDIDGLIHISDLTWDEVSPEELRQYKKGDELSAMVLSVDVERERVALGIKQLDSSEIIEYLEQHPRGSIVAGTVDRIEDTQYIVKLDEEAFGYLMFSDLERAAGEGSLETYKVGDEISAKLLAYNKKNNMVNLSVKDLLREEESKMIEEYSAGDRVASTAIGDLVKDQIKQLKVEDDKE